jgi:hypothetical protein
MIINPRDFRKLSLNWRQKLLNMQIRVTNLEHDTQIN